MSLYAEPLSFEKVALETALPDDPNAWPNALLQELYRQVPFVADFEPEVMMDKVDAEQGFGLGIVLVSNKTAMPRRDFSDPNSRKSAGIKQIRIPVIIAKNMLKSLDLMLTEDGKMYPLTEPRLRQAMFRPQTFDVTGTGPGDKSLTDQLFPPLRMGGMGSGGGYFKSAADISGQLQRVLGLSDEQVAKLKQKTPPSLPKQASLLAATMGKAPEARYQKVASTFDDPSVRFAYASRHAITGPALDVLRSYAPESEASVEPTVVQTYKTAGGYAIKTASHESWAPQEEVVSRGELVRRFGAKVAVDTDVAGAVTQSSAEPPPDLPEGPETSRPALISSFGLYKVRDITGRELIGFVLPNLYDLDAVPLPIALFANGSEVALQASIAGVQAGKASDLPAAEPSGNGLFYRVLSNGSVEGTIPMTITGSYSEGGAKQFQVTPFDDEGGARMVLLQPNLVKPVAVDGALLLPEDMRWLPLGEGKPVVLAATPEEATGPQPQAPVQTGENVVARASDSDSFGLSGPPVDKVASQNLNLRETLFLLAGLGADLGLAQQKLAESVALRRPVTIKVSRRIEPAHEKTAAATEPPIDLVKEAAFLPDPSSVDAVLSLGFLTPDNVDVFVSNIPTLERSQSRLCETLLACRLGLPNVPEPAIEKCVKTLEAVIAGLKVLAFAPAE